MDLDRDTVASAVVGTGGAWLLGSAVVHAQSGKWNSTQLKGLVYAGAGFLMAAAAQRWLQHTGNRGIVVSLMGTLFAMRGMYLLVRERAAERARQSGDQPGKPRPPE
ncbi:MAG TPA: hypothetical protein DGD08_13100 [Gemmatimonas aurantiaca]|uniref:Uncharacterized protein n=2 Tax=Gemmatimonas aurantiaca TaxID=173480 RepID=C1ABH6_GEMAT|nr:hypothetical protein [Gemmatimonas aurantiaca]BAH39853.1 hypothetical protein GAU_2811 [Gemmatimonas aurantiaca T-27]HCT58135.1 hypothetical protein [Gemmatimonas aurantiaca]